MFEEISQESAWSGVLILAEMQPQLQLGNSYSKSTTGRLKWHPFTYNLYGFCFRPKKYSCFRKCGWQEKSSPGRPQSFFWLDFPDILSFLLWFLLLFCILVFLLLLVCLFFEIKSMYSDTHSTMRAGDFHPTDFHSKTPAPESLFK